MFNNYLVCVFAAKIGVLASRFLSALAAERHSAQPVPADLKPVLNRQRVNLPKMPSSQTL